MRVGEIVKRSGASRKALRLYEARGILPPPRRTASGYRVYDGAVLSVLNFVQQCRRLGLTLAEIRRTGFPEFQMRATRRVFGRASLRSCNRLAISSSAIPLSPVTFPPGRARLATRPLWTGSPTRAITMGIVPLALFAA